MNNQYDDLSENQYYIFDGDHLDKKIKKYAELIGLVFINFSKLEHELNLAIAEYLGDDMLELGFNIIERFNMSNKINLFYKLYVQGESTLINDERKTLDIIIKELKELSTFRNYIAHANWQTLTKEGFVHAKIVVDTDDGFVKFKKVDVSIPELSKGIKKIVRLTRKIEQYKDSLHSRIHKEN